MSLVQSGEQKNHRTSRTAVDSGNTPSSWGDAPAAFADMIGYSILRVRVIVNSGTLTGLLLRPITIEDSNTSDSHQEQTCNVVGGSVTPLDFSGLGAMANVYMKIESIAGTTPNVTLVLQGVEYDS